MPLARAVVMDVYDLLGNKEKECFFVTKEATSKTTLEELTINKKNYKEAYSEGDKPYYLNYIMFAHIKPAQIISILTFDDLVTHRQDPVLKSWFNSIQNLYNMFAAPFKLRALFLK
ncbi:hypothetical protein K502DRAFT_364178 [Neoconidiobolus thromboides FSU 785]|nr:hypothetical protein K502DRAFT_364178 [Neoconidiobolus thromboides FSU 785]